MKFVTLSALAFSSTEAQISSISTGLLNVHWTEGMWCPDATVADNLVELVIEETTSNLSYENYKQACAEAFYGYSKEEVPCLQASYFPSGMDFATDPDAPYYSCHGYLGEYLVEPTDAEWNLLASFAGLNVDDENNQIAGCINNSPEDIAGAYSCWRGPLLIGAEYLTLGAAATLSAISMM